jgi:hypothetical protein
MFMIRSWRLCPPGWFRFFAVAPDLRLSVCWLLLQAGSEPVIRLSHVSR